MDLDAFFKMIDEREYIPEIYIVRLEYKFVYEDKMTISNEILQYDPGYFITDAHDPKYPWYHSFWLWYTDWYMCVDPKSIKVLNYMTLEEVFDGKKA